MQTIPGMEEIMQPLDEAINAELIPAILGSDAFSIAERGMFALPLRYGGLGIPQFSELASQDFLASKRITAPLAAIMIRSCRVTSYQIQLRLPRPRKM